jgi:hypothetical protein
LLVGREPVAAHWNCWFWSCTVRSEQLLSGPRTIQAQAGGSSDPGLTLPAPRKRTIDHYSHLITPRQPFRRCFILSQPRVPKKKFLSAHFHATTPLWSLQNMSLAIGTSF